MTCKSVAQLRPCEAMYVAGGRTMRQKLSLSLIPGARESCNKLRISKQIKT